MRQPLHRYLLSVGFLVLMASSCTLTFGPSQQQEVIPTNTGSRTDLNILPVEGDVGYYQGTVQATLGDVISREAAFRSWFFLVDRVSDPNQTLYLTSRVNYWTTSVSRGGTRKYGFYNIYDHSAEVSLKLVDVATGRVIAAATASSSRSVSEENNFSDQLQPVRRAFEKALNKLLLTYTGR